MLDDDHGGNGGGEGGKQLGDGLDPAGGGADGDQLGRTGGARRFHRRQRRPARPGEPDVGFRRRLDLGEYLFAEGRQGDRQILQRLGHEIHRAQFQRPEGDVGALAGQGRHHHHRHRPETHQLFQELDAVHPRHLDVEGQNVGREHLDLVAGDDRVDGGADHFEFGVGRENVGQQLADDRRIIDDQHPDAARRGVAGHGSGSAVFAGG